MRFGHFSALQDVSLNVQKGEFLSLLGPSGSGKTTFLTVLAGFYEPSEGSLLLDGTDMTHVPPGKRGFGMVFQGYALMPHLTVAENIAFPLKVQKRSRAEIRARVEQMIAMVGLEGHGHKKPAKLSGGQQQRVALARALAYEPSVLLLDEPFSALDKNLRLQMQEELRRLHRELGTTFVFVTHDQEEALALSSHVAIFDKGRLQQIGTPEDVYERPANRFVAEFLGDINVFPLAGGAVAGRPILLPDGMGQGSDLAIRPEHMSLGLAEPQGNALPMRVTDRIYLGPSTRLILEGAGGVPATMTLPTATADPAIREGAQVWIGWDARDSFVL